MLKHYAELNTPEPVSLDHWQITPERVREYRKTEAWRNVLVEASKIKEERIKKEIEEREREAEQEKLKKAADAKEVKGPATKPGPSASETEKSARST